MHALRKCVAACPFKAIEAGVEKRRKVVSEDHRPRPKVIFQTMPVIKQVVDVQNYCRGCGVCERVCPNDAIKPVKNNEERLAVKYRATFGDPLKRGGRTNLHTEGRTLDKIKSW